jgi:hypothetical protein
MRRWVREWRVTLALRLREPEIYGRDPEPFDVDDFTEAGPPE